MSDINLLPTDSRKIEYDEVKKKALEKSRVNIELTSPEKKKDVGTPARPAGGEHGSVQKKLGGFKNLVHGFSLGVKKIFSKKPESEKALLSSYSFDSEENKIKPQAAPETPKHFDSINGNGKQPEKKLYYQPTEKKVNIPVNGEKKEEKKELVRNNSQAKRSDSGEEKKDIKPLASAPYKPPEFPKANLSNLPNRSKLDINLIPNSFKLAADLNRQLIILVGAAIGCVLILLVTYLSINFVLNSRQSRVDEIENENQELIQKIDNLKQTNQAVTVFSDLLKQTKQLTTDHIFASHIFNFLETNTLKEVYYTEMQFEAKDLTLTLTAKSKDYQTLARQMLWFQSLTDKVEKIEVLKADLEKEKKNPEGSQEEQKLVVSNLTLKFKPGFLNE